MRFVRDLLTLQVGQVVPIICGFLSSILYPNLLGLDGFGRYAIVLSITGILSLVTNLGQHYTAVSFLAEAYGRKDRDAMRAIGRYYVMISVLMIGVLAAIFPFLPPLTEAVYGDRQLGKLAQLVFASSMLDPLYNYLCIVLQTVRDFRRLTIIENAYIVVQLCIGATLVVAGWGIAGILWGSIITSALSVILACVLLPTLHRKYDLPDVWSLVAIDAAALRTYVAKGFWIAADKNISNLYPNIFLFSLSIRSSPEAVGLARLAFKYANLPASFVLSNISRLAATVVPTLLGQGAGDVRRALMRLARSTAAVHLSATVLTGIAVPVLFPMLYGASFGDALRPFWVVLALHTGLAVHVILTPILRIKNRVYLATIFNMTGFVASSIAFFITAGSALTPLWAFAMALGIYHAISLCVVFPSIRLLRTA